MYEESTISGRLRVCCLFNAGLVRILPPPAKAQDMAALVQVPSAILGAPGEQRRKTLVVSGDLLGIILLGMIMNHYKDPY